jgi:hypothetical protein
MSTLQTANIWFESTGNNRIQSSGSNGVTIFAGGSNVATVNTTAITVSNAYLMVGNSTVNTTVNATTVSVGGVDVNASSLNPYQGIKNRIINGDMRIDQRNNGATSFSISTAGNSYTLDRWRANASGGGVFSIQRSSVAPTGFTNSLIASVTTADSAIGGGDFYHIRQTIEGFNFSDLNFGSAAAKAITVSFWVRSSIIGTYTVLLRNDAGSRGYLTTYTINSANTWEYKTVTVPGDTSGTWPTDNTGCCILSFSLGNGTVRAINSWLADVNESAAGQTQWISTNGATFYITGVQLEVGSSATLFERRSYGIELALCQRYYFQSEGYGSSIYNYGQAHFLVYGPSVGVSNWLWTKGYFPVQMRATPTMNVSDVAGNIGKMTIFTSAGGSTTNNITPYTMYPNINGYTISDYNNSKYGFYGFVSASAEL